MKYRRLWLTFSWLLVVLVVYLSLDPSPPDPLSGWLDSDKLKHMLAYGTLAVCFTQLYDSLPGRGLVACGLIAMGVAMEYLQQLGGQRTFDYADMLANALGVLLGWALMRSPLENLFIVCETQLSRIYDNRK